jgi:ribulose kinase
MASKDALAVSGVVPENVLGLGIDATCSLAVVDSHGHSMSVSASTLGRPGEHNVILWADHRAEDESVHISKSSDPCLSYLGGSVDVRRCQ